MIIHRRNKMDEHCFVTQIRKKKYKNGEIPQGVLEPKNTEERQLKRELILNNMLTHIVEFVIPNIPDLQDEAWTDESLYYREKSIQEYLCLPPEQINGIMGAMKLFLDGIRKEEESEEKMQLNFDEVRPESNMKYGQGSRCDNLITKLREDDSSGFQYEKGLSSEEIDDSQLLKEKMMSRLFYYIIKIVLKTLSNLKKENGFKVDKELFWQDCNELSWNFSNQQSERIVEIVKLCLYNLVEEIKGYEQQNSVSKS